MTYKRKFAILSAITAALAIAYILGVVFEPERRSERNAAFSWLEPRIVPRIDTITITKGETALTLLLQGGRWYVSQNEKKYPAKQLRAADFVGLFTRRAPYPVLSTSASSHERLGLDEAFATRITFSGGEDSPVLDILIGQPDVTGRNVYMRKYGQNEVYSGENVFTAYTSGELSSWYNLRLIPETEDGRLDIDQIQRLTVYSDSSDASAAQVFTRNGREWTVSGMEIPELDMSAIDAYARGVLTAEGSEFNDTISVDAPELNESRILIELGNGEIKSIRFSAPDENDNRLAAVSGSDLVYSIPMWVSARLFYENDHFKKQPQQ
ncbi:MAG TPA: hypothetical protein DEQ14_06870 [Treponema sp.]|nr:hypothetical protein [Treponema sp.]